VAGTRRLGTEDSATRLALVDAARRIMLESGYAAVTSRKVAARAGLKPQLVHYYFRTMDDLFLAVVRSGAEQNLERQRRALAAPDPLRALWEFASDPAGATMTMEFSALANHRKAIRVELAAYAEQFRRLQSEALAALLSGSGIDVDAFPPETLAFVMTAIAQMLVLEETLGLATGHDRMRAAIEEFIARSDHARMTAADASAPREAIASRPAGT
jgi:AcrR family transcriptional regulator